MDKKKLIVPQPRRSVEIINSLRDSHLNFTLDNSLHPNATSTAEKQDRQSLADRRLTDNHLPKNSLFSECGTYEESSLGLLDIDKDFEGTNALSNVLNEFNSLSFNVKEMSGRSTYLINNHKSKENRAPSKPSSSRPINRKSLLCIDDILRDANKQSEAVDEILKGSDNPDVANIRMSLDSYKQSLSGPTTINKTSWNFRPDDFGQRGALEGDSELRDSMFASDNKIDMSKEELSWMKEHGDLPMHPNSMTFTSGSDKNNSNKFSNDTLNDFTSLRSNISNLSKMSVGNYFKRRSDNINCILTAPSPEKVGPFPPLYDPEDELFKSMKSSSVPVKNRETYCKSKTAKSLPFHTLSDDSDEESSHYTTHNDVAVLSHINNLYPKHSNICKDITNTIAEESICGSPISCSQIKLLVDNYDTEKRSLLLDNLLAQTKLKSKKDISEGSSNQRKQVSNENMRNRDEDIQSLKQQTMEKSSKGQNNENHTKGKVKKSVSPTLPDRSSFGCTSKIFHSTKHGEEFQDKLSRVNVNKSPEYRKSKRSSVDSYLVQNKVTKSMSQTLTSFGNDDNSSAFVSTLKNNAKSNSGSSGFTESSVKSSNTVVPAKLSTTLNAINEIGISANSSKSPNRDVAFGCFTDKKSQNEMTFSDTSKEIMNIMSPASSNNDKSSQNSSKTWISPFKDKMNASSKDHWISIESNQECIIVGHYYDVTIKLTSMSQRWISAKFSINSLYVDEQLYCNDHIISQYVLLEPFASPILLNENSEIVCKIKTTALMANQLLKVNISFNLTDMVTKEESSIKHDILLITALPKLEIKSEDMNSDTIQFPPLPEGVDACIPFFLFNNSNKSLSIELSISCPYKDVFAISTVTVIPREDANKYYLTNTEHSVCRNIIRYDRWKSHSNSLCNMEQFTIPEDKSNCLKVLLHYKSPHLVNLEKSNGIQYVDAILNVNIIPQCKMEMIIPLKRLSIVGGIGLWKLTVKNKHIPLMINQGSSEDIWLMNEGSMNIHYKIYISDYDRDSKGHSSANPIFMIDKNEVHLKPGTETKVNVIYPMENASTIDLQKKLILSSVFETQRIDLIGVASRSMSQQSVYSIDSASSQSQNAFIKSSKRELSWGSLKIGSNQVKDLALKNTSNNNKMSIMVSITEDGFKLLSERGPVSTMIFTLLPQECKTLRVEFHPNKAGGFIGSLKITHRTKTASNLLSKVMLHGVGDISMLVFKDGVFRHGGSQGLPLGSLSDSGDTKDIYFSIWNKGNAAAFVLFHLDLKWKYRTLHKEIKVVPQSGIIGADNVMRCVVQVPKKAVLLARGKTGDAENLATLTILHGDDSTRQRIKRICSQNVIDESIKEAWNDESQGKLTSLCMHFPEESQQSRNINIFKESPFVLKLLLDELQQKEVLLTYDIDLDSTIVRISNEFDETVQFHTLCADNTQDTITSDI